MRNYVYVNDLRSLIDEWMNCDDAFGVEGEIPFIAQLF